MQEIKNLALKILLLQEILLLLDLLVVIFFLQTNTHYLTADGCVIVNGRGVGCGNANDCGYEIALVSDDCIRGVLVARRFAIMLVACEILVLASIFVLV